MVCRQTVSNSSEQKRHDCLHPPDSFLFLYLLFLLLPELILLSATLYVSFIPNERAEGTDSLISLGFSRRLTEANFLVFLAFPC